MACSRHAGLRSRRRKSSRALDVAELAEMDAVVLRLEKLPLAEVEIAQAGVLEDQSLRIERGELFNRGPAALAGGLHRRDQLSDWLAVLGPHHRRRVGGSRRPRRQGSNREVGRMWCEPAGRLGFTRELRGELARRDLGDREGIDDLAGRPFLLGRLPVGLPLREAGDLAQDVGARGFEIVPQGLDRTWKCHDREYTSSVLGFSRDGEGSPVTDHHRELARAAWRTLTTRSV